MHSPWLRITNLKKYYQTKHKTIKALNDVSIDIFKNEVIGLLGPNGAGKTTLSSTIATLHPPTSGDITINNVSIYNNVYAYRQIMGYCAQYPNLNKDMTLEENLYFAGLFYNLPKQAIKNKIAQLAEEFELTTYLDCKAEMLSGGYRQRFMIARTLIHNPQLVILDEPTVGLDPHVRHQLWEKIRDIKKQGATVLLTTHYIDEAEILSDRICILDGGRIRLIGDPTTLKSTYQKSRLEDVFLHIMNEKPTKEED